jgi:translation initiation factor SUI1
VISLGGRAGLEQKASSSTGQFPEGQQRTPPDYFFTDPFADASKGDDLLPAGTEDYIHIRIQQRNGRKTLTTVQGIADDYDKKKLVKAFKKVGLLWREHVVWSTKGEGANVKGVRVDGMAS